MRPHSIYNFNDSSNDGHRFGLGAIVPKEVRDGSFTNRLPTSHEKLLENLIGKKAAKAHLAAKQKHTAPSKPQKPAKPVETKDESDEEEGRAAAFQSKRQRRTRPVPTKSDSSDEDEESRTSNLASKKQKTTSDAPSVTNGDVTMGDAPDREDVDEPKKVAPTSRSQKAKPKSYLDEILGEKSKKKKKKKGKGNDAKVDE